MDILDRLDAAVAEADASTDQLCEQYFADAMAGVREAIDCTQGLDLNGDPCEAAGAIWATQIWYRWTNQG